MKQQTILAALACLSLFGLPSSFAGESKTDEIKKQIVSSYVTIQEGLANEALDDVKAPAESIERLSIDLGSSAQKDAMQIRKSAQKIAQAKSLKDARAAFKDLSKPVVAWIQKDKPSGLEVDYCPMAGAKWVQKKGEIKNPYLGKDMVSCGENAS